MLCRHTVSARQLHQKSSTKKIGDSPMKSDIKLGPQTHLGAESQSEWTIQLVQKSWIMVIIIPRRAKECTWQFLNVHREVSFLHGLSIEPGPFQDAPLLNPSRVLPSFTPPYPRRFPKVSDYKTPLPIRRL